MRCRSPALLVRIVELSLIFHNYGTLFTPPHVALLHDWLSETGSMSVLRTKSPKGERK
jgi:hypothetical protein